MQHSTRSQQLRRSARFSGARVWALALAIAMGSVSTWAAAQGSATPPAAASAAPVGSPQPKPNAPTAAPTEATPSPQAPAPEPEDAPASSEAAPGGATEQPPPAEPQPKPTAPGGATGVDQDPTPTPDGQPTPPPVVEAVAAEEAVLEQPAPALAESRRTPPGPFNQFNFRVSLLAGTGSFDGEAYFILGGGAGFYVIDGLEVGFGGEMWLGPSPFIGRLTPQLTYVLHFVPFVKPYAGAFFTHTVIDGYGNYNSAGPRAGVNFVFSRYAYVGLGAAFEFIIDCGSAGVSPCENIRPELTAAFSF